MGVAGFSQRIPLFVVLGDGQSLEHGQARFQRFGFKAAKGIGLGGAVVRVLHHKHEGRGLAVALQGLAHAARFCAVAAQISNHMGKGLSVNGALSHHGNVRATGLSCRFVCICCIFKGLKAQGKGNGCSLRAAFHIEIAAVGTGQLPRAGECQRRPVAGRYARAAVSYGKEQMTGVGGFGHAPHRKVHRTARGGAHGAFEQHT